MTYQYEAEDLLKKIKEGADFSDLARRFSKCGSAAQGGDLGPVESGRLEEAFAEAAGALTTGEISPVVRSRFGYHLIKKIN